ncbi:hypothetical protein ABZ946_05190 [Streptomyces sp. NPDC046324]|uniref:hypothetical protein n=1 Tax=Streptomyces sp. NPDC046324 TaxID=3154915 RepID=UPI0033CBE48D
MATPERAEARISMSELLASCAAANVVSTPPRESDRAETDRPDHVEQDIEREAA